MRSSVRDSHDCSVVESVHNNAILGVLSPNFETAEYELVGRRIFLHRLATWSLAQRILANKCTLLRYGVRLRSEK
jgi:hypothetical protein